MQALRIEGRRVACAAWGEGPTLVLLHGGGSSHRQWQRTAGALRDRYRVVAPDFWGFGETDAWDGPAPLTLDHQARLVAHVVDALAPGPVHLVGHSYGGATAIRFMLAHPQRVATAVLIEPAVMRLLERGGHGALYGEWWAMIESFMGNEAAGRLDEAWRGFIDYRNGAGRWDAMTEAARERLRASTATTLAGFGSILANPTTAADLASIDARTLVLVGENTTAPDRVVCEIVSETIPGARLEILPGAEHMSPISHPDAVADAIARHVGAVSRAA